MTTASFPVFLFVFSHTEEPPSATNIVAGAGGGQSLSSHHLMAPRSISFLSLLLLLSAQLSSSTLFILHQGSSLSVDNPGDVLVSPNDEFSAGFFPVGDNAFAFSIWHSRPACSSDCTPVWMANREVPVNGKRSQLSLQHDGDLVLKDAGASVVWSSNTAPQSSTVTLRLSNTGNLFLSNASGSILWQSFDWPTDTLLPQQMLTRSTSLVSSRSRSNYSAGFYKLYFDNDNVLRILYDGPTFSSPFWPYPWLQAAQWGRFLFNSSKVAKLDNLGHFSSSDKFEFFSSDYGIPLQRKLTMDPDGNLRLYSRPEGSKNWSVTWQAIQIPCFIHGVCGNNSLCSYDPVLGRSCSCVPGYKRIDPNDWSVGCEPDFQLSDGCSPDVSFVKVLYMDFYGYDGNSTFNTTRENCQSLCSEMCSCRGYQYTWSDGKFDCYLKVELINGHNLPSFSGEFYLKVNKSMTFTQNQLEKREKYTCPTRAAIELNRHYRLKGNNGVITFMLYFASIVGAIELLVVFLVWFFFFRSQQDITAATHSYFLAATGFQRFTYSDLKKATKNFSQQIGAGAGGTVYKAVLPDNRVAAVKLLNQLTTGEADFLAEASTIGKLNHMNLIEMWGYCAEGKHRLLVYEYMEHGSLAQNLSSSELNWKRRFDIAVGTAKGLAYLHEECLEWVLHCDVKPQNILLDSDYQPKVADFGMSKLMDRGKGMDNSDFSRIRGTRGYMAPEWVSNQAITSKVDVFSYGIVVLELVTGVSPAGNVQSEGGDVGVVTWVRRKMREPSNGVKEIVDPRLEGIYDEKKMEVLVEVAIRCVAEDKDARPSMGEVVEMLLKHENGE